MAMDEKASTTDPVDIDDDFVVELVKKPLRLYVINGPHKGLEFKAQIPGNDRKKYQFGIGRGKIFTTGNGKHIINGLCLSKDSEISNKHAEVSFLETGQVFFLDRGSKHGSYLNSTKLSANVSTPVHNRDEIRIGNTTIRVDTVLEAPKAEDFCFICNKSLASLTRVLEKEMHINACLDQQTKKASTQSRKKTQGVLTAARPKTQAQESIHMAMAMSLSVCPPDAITLEEMELERELEGIELELKRLRKRKREVSERLSCLKKPVRPAPQCAIVPPGSKLDEDRAIGYLFPTDDKAKLFAVFTFDKKTSLATRHRLALWNLAGSKVNAKHRLAPFYSATQDLATTVAFLSAEAPVEIESIFPEWKENINFLFEKTLSELQNARQQLGISIKEEKNVEKRYALLYFQHAIDVVCHYKNK